ncbi:MAG: hypothetical protein H6686_03615 [Fibrobacteria bacterium]|nr:hypothetical protein [Fibrobacteria bacterium]
MHLTFRLLPLLLLLAGTCLASSDTDASADSTAWPPVPETVHRSLCQDLGSPLPGSRPHLQSVRNAQGDLGGFLRHDGILDGPVCYYDRSGIFLACFSIFGTDAEKDSAMALIQPLLDAYPLQQEVQCPKRAWKHEPLRR